VSYTRRVSIRSSFVLVLLGIAPCASAQLGDVDWKYFGGIEHKGATIISFYDEKGVVHGPNGRIEVWTKALAESDAGRILSATEPDKATAACAIEKIGADYVPPFAHVAELNADQMFDVVAYECVAMQTSIETKVRTMFELNCPARTLRVLSAYFKDSSGSDSGKPSEWLHIAPETSVAWLAKLLCPISKPAGR